MGVFVLLKSPKVRHFYCPHHSSSTIGDDDLEQVPNIIGLNSHLVPSILIDLIHVINGATTTVPG